MPEGEAIWNFDSQVVVITDGCSPRAVAQAKAFLGAGSTVLPCDRDPDRLKDLYDDGDLGGSVEPMAVDCSDETAMERLAEHVSSRHGRLDVLVVNDPALPDAGLFDITDEAWGGFVSTHLDSAFFCAKHLVPLILPARRGKVVFTTGPETSAPIVGRAHACAMRQAVFGFAKDLALEVAKDQVNVNLATAAAAADDVGPDQEAAVDTLTHVVMWLASDAARFVTGTRVRAGGDPVLAQLANRPAAEDAVAV